MKADQRHHALMRMLEPLVVRAFENKSHIFMRPTETGIGVMLALHVAGEAHLVRASLNFGSTSAEANAVQIQMSKALSKSISRHHARVSATPVKREFIGGCEVE